jgi:putative transposase
MSKTLAGLRYRLCPNPGHERLLAQSAGACRWLWNWALDYREGVWLAAKSAGAVGLRGSVGYVHLSSLLPGLKREYPWLSRAPHHALQATLRDLDRAFANFFAGRAGFPRFRRRGDSDALRFPDPKQFAVEGDWVRLPKLGWVAFRRSRAVQGRVRNITVSREGRHWNISFCVEGAFVLPNAGLPALGLDLGVAQSVTTSSGEVIAFPVTTPKEDRRMRFLQRRASRRLKGSVRRRRAYEAVAKLRRHQANRRRDAAHKLSTRLATTHASIAIEDLKLKELTSSAAGTIAAPGHRVQAKSRLNRGMLAQGHADFRRMLIYKCERSGARLLVVNPAYTSQTCSQCGHCAPENRESQAVFRCVACGSQLNADHNAALNILAAGHGRVCAGRLGVTSAGELRTHPRNRPRKRPGPTGIPAKAASAADREDVKSRSFSRARERRPFQV